MAGNRKERHLVGSVSRGWGLKRRFRIGTVRRNKRYSAPFFLFNSRSDLPTSLSPFVAPSRRRISDSLGWTVPSPSRKKAREGMRGCEDERAIFSYQ